MNKKNTKPLLLITILLVTLQVLAAKVTLAQEAGTIAETIPFVQDSHNRVIVDAHISGIMLHLLVDTCSKCLLSQAAIRKISQKDNPNSPVPTKHIVHDLSINRFFLSEVDFASKEDRFMANISDDVQIDGILGIEVLEDLCFQLNFSKHEMLIFMPAQFSPKANVYSIPLIRIPSSKWERYFQLQCELSGKKKLIVGMLLDTGAEGVYLPAKLKTKDFSVIAQVRGTVSKTLKGAYENVTYRLPNIKLGSATITNVVADQLAPDKFINEGIIGMDIFQRFTVTMDFPHKALYLEANPDFHEDNSKWIGIGIGVLKEGASYIIRSVVRPSPAFSAGIRTGDVIAAINGKRTENMSLNAIYGCWKLAGKTIKLQVQRKGEAMPREYTLTVRKLL